MLRAGHPVIVVVGLPDAAVKESKDRVTTAISNSGYHWPMARTTINLAPADVKKEGPSFDLPIALAMIAVQQERELPFAHEFCFVGELALTGAVRSVRGVLPVAIEARKRGRKKLIVPVGNVREAAMVEGIEVFGVANLREAYEFLIGEKPLLPSARGSDGFLRAASGEHGARFRRCAWAVPGAPRGGGGGRRRP